MWSCSAKGYKGVAGNYLSIRKSVGCFREDRAAVLIIFVCSLQAAGNILPSKRREMCIKRVVN